MTTLDTALDFTLEHEGGWANHPNDKGGPTMYGITKATYDAYRRARQLPMRSVRQISREETRDIYEMRYWRKFRCDAVEVISPRLAIMLFDFVVHSGNWGVKHLQRVLSVAQDGAIGPKTLASIAERVKSPVGHAKLLAGYLEDRRSFLLHLATKPGQDAFRDGWMNRIEDLRRAVRAGSVA